MQRNTRTIVALLLAIVPCASAILWGQQPVITPSGTIPILESYLEALRQQSGIPGMSAAVVKDGVVVWEKGYGFQNTATRLRATPDTPYLVGDVSQTLAAILLLQCVEQRRMDLDEPFEHFGLSAPTPNTTLRQLLSHAAPDGAKEPFAYSPDRYALLTPVMEWCAPQPYRKSVAHRILDRLAMKDSVPGTDLQNPDLELPEGLFDSEDLDRYRHVLERLAVPYKVDGRGRSEQRTDIPPSGINAAGGLVSTVRDLARLDSALDARLDDALGSGLLLLPETLGVAWSPTGGRNGTPSPMGLGWFVQTYRGQRVVWHFGYVPNAYSSLVLKLPERNLTFILLANSDGLSAPFQLQSGDVTRSLFATLFLRLAT
jgi:CubicO group peptidase (beta-lactamase class C family)